MERKAGQYMEECWKRCFDKPKTWNYETGVMLIGAKQMYEATGEEKYFPLIESCLDSFVTQDGAIKDYPEEKANMESISCGRILYFMYDKTKDEKYRKAIEFIMDRLREYPRCECGNFLYQKETPDEVWLDALYMAMPFYMEYETKYEKKEKYNDIINQFENVRKFLYNEKKELCVSGFQLKSVGRYLAALIDAMDNMSFEIYEQYRALQDDFKLTLKNMLSYQSKDSMLFSLSDSFDAAGNALIAYCIMKACRMGILLKEKYASSGMKMLESLMEKEELSGENRMDDAEGVGAFLMAYGQYLQLNKEMD